MSYYYKHQFSFSDHGFQRIKQRLGFKNLNDFEAKDKAMKLIELSMRNYEDREYYYVQAGDLDLFFVIKKSTNLILTLTPMSSEKLLKIYSND